jgi:hypothetical protein
LPRRTSSDGRSPSSVTLDRHQQLHAALRISGHRITGVILSFIAPYAVSSARDEYLIEIPNDVCGGPGTGGSQLAIGHNVTEGTTVSETLDAGEVFIRACGASDSKGRQRIRELAVRSATLEVLYRRIGEPPVTVGSIVLQAPAGSRPKLAG